MSDPGYIITGESIGYGYGSPRLPTPRGIKIYGKPGTYSWTAPQGVFGVEVAIYSAGGGGGTTSDAVARSAGGGGGGAFAIYCVGCTPGSTYSLTVGRGGSPGSASTLRLATNVFAGSTVFSNPTSAAVDKQKNIYISDTGSSTIKKLTPSGSASVVNFSGSALKSPQGVAVDKDGEVYVADTLNHVIRKTTGIIAGSIGVSGSQNGTGTTARFNSPAGIAVDQDKNIFVSDTGNHTIRKITPSGVVTTFAGAAGEPGAVDSSGGGLLESRFNTPRGIAVDSNGNIYVADYGNHAVRIVEGTDGYVSTFAGKMGESGFVNGEVTITRYNGPYGVAVDNDDSIYVADRGNNTVRKTILTLTNNAPVYVTQNIANASQPTSVTVVGNETVYTTTAGDNKVLKTESSGGTGGDGGDSICNIGRSVVIRGGGGGGSITPGTGGTVPSMGEVAFNNASLGNIYFTGLEGAGPGEMNNNSYGGGPASTIGDGQLALVGGRGWLIWVNTQAGGGGAGKNPYRGEGSQGGHGAIILQW